MPGSGLDRRRFLWGGAALAALPASGAGAIAGHRNTAFAAAQPLPGTPVYATRAQLMAEPAPSPLSYVSEVHGTYAYAPTSATTPDGWVVLPSAAGGRFAYEGDELTLPILGNGQDDWPNFGAANAACAASGIRLRLGPGTYEARSRQFMANDLHVVCTPQTRVHCAIPVVDNRDSPFLAYGAAESGTTMAADALIGDRSVRLTIDLGFSEGDHIVLIVSTFRAAIYEVQAYDASTRTVTLDRPLRMAHGSQIGAASFPAGTLAYKYVAAHNIILELNGAALVGSCARYIEFIAAWRCYALGPAFLGDGSTDTAVERLISIDAPTYDCHATHLTGDGGGITALGLSFESSEACSFSWCSARGCTYFGLTIQDSIDSVAYMVTCNDNVGNGAGFTGGETTLLGSDGCTLLKGSYSGNQGNGIVFERGASRCQVDGASAVGNRSNGVLVNLDAPGFDNVVSGNTVSRRNGGSGVYVGPVAVRTRITECQASDNVGIGVLVAQGATASTLSGVDASRNLAGLVLYGDTDCQQVTSVSRVGAIDAALTVGPQATVRVRGSRLDLGVGRVTVVNLGTLDIADSTVTVGAGGVAIGVFLAGLVRTGRGCLLTGQGPAGHAIYIVGGTAILGSGAVTEGLFGSFPGGRYNFGTLTIGLLASATVEYPELRATDSVELSPIVATGIHAVATNPGVGFTVVGFPGDQYRWKVR